MKKGVFIIAIATLIILIVFLNINTKDKQDKISDYVIKNETEILNCISEIIKLPDTVKLDYGEKIVNVGNAKINRYVDDVDELYIEIKGSTKTRRAAIKDQTLLKILNGKPVRNIGIDNGTIIFDCGCEGIAPSSQDYYFYYSPDGDPRAVFDGKVICDSSQMTPEGKGYEYIDDGHNSFYTEKITDDFYFCEASF